MFGLPIDSPVFLKIYNIKGQEIISPLDGQLKEVGWHSIEWDGRDRNNILVPTGVYLYKLLAGKTILTKKMILIK